MNKGELTESEAIAEIKKSVNISSEGSVWAKPSKIGCLVWLEVRDEDGLRVLLTEKTRIRTTGHVFSSTRLEMGISTYAANGGFSGKYSHEIPTQQLNLTAKGKFEWIVDVGDLFPQTGNSPIHSLVHDWWCVADSNTAKLEIIRVDILDE